MLQVSGITIRYPHSQKIGKPNNLNVLVARKAKGINKKTKIGYGHLCLKEKIRGFNNNYII